VIKILMLFARIFRYALQGRAVILSIMDTTHTCLRESSLTPQLSKSTSPTLQTPYLKVGKATKKVVIFRAFSKNNHSLNNQKTENYKNKSSF